ncbi:hypothetical protein [Oerskovia sp. USHLN155]|uniref:hypothetical protein n=1 Tax=Oerskovia sp. USHLN155 TaxID=3081288 RepID=UPI00301AA8E9
MLPVDPAHSARLNAVPHLVTHLSPERIAPYETDATARGVDAITLYSYNLSLAASLLGPLNVAEIVVRNAMQGALSAHFGRDDWWEDARVELPTYQENSLRDVQEKLRKKFAREGGRPVLPCDVVAALEFGFWTGLLGDGPEGYSFERQLWQPALRRGFPYNRRDRDGFRKLVDGVRRLRNRVMHHEPLYRDKHKTALRYEDILYVIASVSPELRTWVDQTGSARHRLAAQPTDYKGLRF